MNMNLIRQKAVATLLLIATLFGYQNCQKTSFEEAAQPSMPEATVAILSALCPYYILNQRQTLNKQQWTFPVHFYGYNQPNCAGTSTLFLADYHECYGGSAYDSYAQCEAQRQLEINRSCDTPQNTLIYGQTPHQASVDFVPISGCKQLKDLFP